MDAAGARRRDGETRAARPPETAAAVPVASRPGLTPQGNGALETKAGPGLSLPDEARAHRALPELAEAAADGIVRGYAALFGQVDLAGDRIVPGAFAASLARRGAAGIRMLWQHEPGRPIGIWTTIAEDRRGLRVEGRLALATRGGREAFQLIAAGAVDGLSIGFRTKRAAKEAGGGAKRRLVEIDLWEISVVTFPMQQGARVLALGPGGVPLARQLRAGAERIAVGR